MFCNQAIQRPCIQIYRPIHKYRTSGIKVAKGTVRSSFTPGLKMVTTGPSMTNNKNKTYFKKVIFIIVLKFKIDYNVIRK